MINEKWLRNEKHLLLWHKNLHFPTFSQINLILPPSKCYFQCKLKKCKSSQNVIFFLELSGEGVEHLQVCIAACAH